jgi:XRE family transcriptional regulator, regulator of sulfur utilization
MAPQPASPDPALGRAIRALREQRKLTQEGLAFAAGMAFATVSAVERGRTVPTWATVRAISLALDVSMAELGAAIDAQER